MKRLLGLVLVGALVVGASTMVAPRAAPGPDFEGPQPPDAVASTAASVWYCPWVASGALRDSSMLLAATVPVDIRLSFPAQMPGEPADIDEASLRAAGALVVNVGDITRRGDTPAFVEFDDGPAAAAAVESGDDLLTGDVCIARIPKVWQLPGGTTREGRHLTLRLFNPFPEPAKVSIDGKSESGETGLVDLQNLDVMGRGWQDINLNQLLPLLDDLSFTVTTSEGFIIPSLVLAGSTDEASWPGSAPATTLEFPVVTPSGDFTPTLLITNPGSATTVVQIDVYTDSGTVPAAREVEVAPDVPRRVDVSDLADGGFGVRLRAESPIAAVVVAEESPVVLLPEQDQAVVGGTAGDRIAGTIGSPAPARRWLAPGLQGVAAGDATLWLLNSGAEAATVTLQPLGVRPIAAVKKIVAAGSLLQVPLGYDVAVGGYSIESSQPVSVAWSVESDVGLMFVAGIAVDA